MARQKKAVGTSLANVGNNGLINVTGRCSGRLNRGTTGEDAQIGRRNSREAAGVFTERSAFPLKKIDILKKSTAADLFIVKPLYACVHNNSSFDD